MSRRSKPEKREIPPDVRYNSVQVQNFINRVVRRRKKSTATRLVYDAFDLIADRTKRNPLEVFEPAMKNVSPLMEVKPRRVGGANLPGAYGSAYLSSFRPGFPLAFSG